MLIVKFVVSLFCLYIYCACETDYCEICANHTMCQYRVEGPGPECISYDYAAFLTTHDIADLVNKINERRNYVAMGFSSVLPGAANMRKINWSPDLAKSAQRWVDQCDTSVRPDKEDDCRDLAYTKVGQNIASVIGPSPGLNVKSFAETWFMQVLDYKGSVTYYNQSRDYKTNHFTQLIWAETEAVGCGKAKFYLDERNTMLERVVCNFAPKGNMQGKPVYAIGYAGTQCAHNTAPDNHFKGLCRYKQHERVRKLQTQRAPVSSLLRILNLNSSVKQEIDPLRTPNIKQNNFNANNRLQGRHQKTRHVITNNTVGPMKRATPFRKPNLWRSLRNMSRNDYEYHYPYERGHSRVYHGHELFRNNAPTTQASSYHNFRRYEYTGQTPYIYDSTNYNKHNIYQQCTRKMTSVNNDCQMTHCADKHCTRGTYGCHQSTTYQPTFREIPSAAANHIYPHNMCPCTKRTCASTTNCNCKVNCVCPHAPCSTSSRCFTTSCPRIHRMPEEDFKDGTRKSGTFQYYDMIPNVIVRSGNQKTKKENSPPKDTPWFYDHISTKIPFQEAEPQINYNDPAYTQVKDTFVDRKSDNQDHDYLYRSVLDPSRRRKRESESEINVTPFWKIDANNDKKLTQLKSLRYTTLSNKRHKKTRKTKESFDSLINTEPITIKLDVPGVQITSQGQSTEKYMSFEELLHLRKFSDRYEGGDARRQGNSNKKQAYQIKDSYKLNEPSAIVKEVPSTISTPTNDKTIRAMRRGQDAESTANTPFPRIKHCTRKLTCTWTEFTVIGVSGANDGAGTLPGFQSGCSRTSTCTRDYKDRNKMSTLPEIGSGDDAVSEDDDYCERRKRQNKEREIKDTVFGEN